MPVEMIGWVTPYIDTEIFPVSGAVFDHSIIERAARLHEEAGFDLALVAYSSDDLDGFMVAAHAATVTQRLGFLMAHRPGFIAPTVAARKFASLDQLTRGRAAIHLIAGGGTDTQAMDGDFVDHDARYRRMIEYVEVMQRVWTEPIPFDHKGEFYKVVQAYSKIRCRQRPMIPIFGGGGSPAAIDALAPIVDVFMLWGEPLVMLREFMSQVRSAAGPSRHDAPGFSVSTRPILGQTEKKAWERAYRYLEQAKALHPMSPVHENIGSKRLLDIAQGGAVHDDCLWTEIAAVTGAYGNTTALVGTADTVARALFEYYKLGARHLLIRGFDPLPDTEEYGRELIPRLRELVTEYDREHGE